MSDFISPDFLLLDDTQFSAEERLVRDSVREWVSKEFLPRIQAHVRQDGAFPMDLVPQIAELGVFGANLEGYGCAGMNNVAYGLVMQELERGDSGLRSFASVQGSLCMYPIMRYGSDEQKRRWLPEMAAGRVIGCFGLTEPDFGSFVTGMTTRAEKKRRRLGAERGQALDHQRQRRPRRRSSGRERPKAVHGFLVENRPAGLRGARHQGQVLAAGLDHLRALPAGRRACPSRAACRARRAWPARSGA